MFPEGEPAVYSPTSPGGSPSSSQFNEDLMSGIVDEPHSDFRDILMLYEIEESPLLHRLAETRARTDVSAHGSRGPETCPAMASPPASPLTLPYPTKTARLETSPDIA